MPTPCATVLQFWSEELSPAQGWKVDADLDRQAIVEHSGRYPHRNPALGSRSTPEEWAFLATPGSRF
jgi:uncharacterized protein (DUF924 family)